MRIVCVDAGPINGGATSRAVRSAALAAEAAGAEVHQLRLYDVYASICSSCGACAVSARCSSRDDRIAALCELFATAHALAIAAPASLASANPVAEALLERMLRSCAGLPDDAARRPRTVPAATRRVTAAVLVPCVAALAPAVRLGKLSGTAAAVAHALQRAGLEHAEFLPVSVALQSPGACERLARKSHAVGERLVRSAWALPAGKTFSDRRRRAERHRRPLTARHA